MDIYEKNLKKIILTGLILFISTLAIIFIFFKSKEYELFNKRIYFHVQSAYEKNIYLHLKYNINLIINEINIKHNKMENNIKSMLKNDVNKAYKIAITLYNNFRDKLPRDKLEEVILSALKSLQTKDKYIFAADFKGINQLNPVLKRGINTLNFKDIKGKYIVKEIIKIAKSKGSGFIEYYWYKPQNPNKILKKLSYIRRFEPFNWYIGEGYYLIDMEKKVKKEIVNFIKRLNKEKRFIFKYFLIEYTNKQESFLISTKQINISNFKYLKLLYQNNQSDEYTFRFENHKLIIFKYYKDWNWLLGCVADLNSFYSNLSQEKKLITRETFHYLILFFILSSIIIFCAIIFSFILSNYIVKKLKKYRKQIEEKEIFQKRLIDTIPLPILVMDLEGNLIQHNVEFENFFNFPNKSNISEELELIKKIIKADIYLAEHKITPDLVKITEIGLYNKYKELRDFKLYKSFFTDLEGKILGVVCVFLDVTEQKRFEDKLLLMSNLDPLTGLYNRRFFYETLKREFEKFKRYNYIFSLVMLDIDNFKKINDFYGHSTGDEILKEIVALIKKNIRNIDIFCRVGGEEFIILAPNTKLKDAEILAEKIRKIVNHHEFKTVGKVTISLGVTQVKENDNEDIILNRVDQALYLAKNRGKNRVEVLFE